jgi:hypothetical protein
MSDPIYLLPSTPNSPAAPPIHILTNGKANIGSNNNAIITSSNPIINSCKLGIGSTDVSGNMNNYGVYYTDGVSATQIAAETTINRPAQGKPGYVRYNSTTFLIEYWNTNTNSWVAIAEPTPNVVNISPSYVPEDSSFNYTVTGMNFTQFSSITFIGNVDNLVYIPYGGTVYVSPTTLQARNSLAMSNASNNTAFYVKVTNTDSGLSGQSITPLVSFNTGPQWTTASGANLGTGVTNQTYTTGTTPISAMVATDIDNPVTYAYTSAPSTVTGNVLLDSTTGKLYNQMPTALNDVLNYDFIAQATDASGSLSVPRTFSFRVVPTSYTLTSPTGSITTGYFTPNSYGSSGLLIPYVPGATTTGFAYTITFDTDVSLNILLKGGDGGGGYQYNQTSQALGPLGGGGAWAYSQFNFTKNTQYKLLIGGGGLTRGPQTTPGDYVNGGGGLAGNLGFGGQGGGYSGLFNTSVTHGNSLLVAAGGGGGAYEVYFYSAQLGPTGTSNVVVCGPTNGGSGGDLIGIDGLTSNSFSGQSAVGTSGTSGSSGGSGGTQSAGGAGGSGGGGAGAALIGGNCGASGDGGGGGGGGSGYYGGGSGTGANPGSSGAGGSSYISAASLNALVIGGIPTTSVQTNGQNGYAYLYYSLNNAVVLTRISGGALPTPTTVNSSYCYSFIAVAGVTTTYTFTINYPVVMGYLCVAGGGGGGGNGGGGGGGGGLLQGTTLVTAGTNITITVGAGGAASATGAVGNSGINSSISGGITSTITSIGGGGGGTNDGSGGGAKTGGSGGGGGSDNGSALRLSCAGNIGTQGQGYPGGFGMHISGSLLGGGGGGGAGGCGSNLGPQDYNSNSPVVSDGGTGGKGLTSWITGSPPVGYAGGGGGGMNSNTVYGRASGWGGGGTSSNLFGAGNGGGGGGPGSGGSNKAPTAGTNNTGGGGGGGEHPNTQIGAAGGSGIVVIRVPRFW